MACSRARSRSFHSTHRGLCAGEEVGQRLRLAAFQYLGKIADRDARARCHTARVGFHGADDDLEQRRLADAIRAHQPPFVARVEAERHIVEHLVVAIGLGETDEVEEHRTCIPTCQVVYRQSPVTVSCHRIGDDHDAMRIVVTRPAAYQREAVISGWFDIPDVILTLFGGCVLLGQDEHLIHRVLVRFPPA